MNRQHLLDVGEHVFGDDGGFLMSYSADPEYSSTPRLTGVEVRTELTNPVL